MGLGAFCVLGYFGFQAYGFRIADLGFRVQGLGNRAGTTFCHPKSTFGFTSCNSSGLQ